MNAGKLRHRLTIEADANVVNGVVMVHDSVGQAVESWQAIDTVWASIEPLSGRELTEARQRQAQTTHKITIRYRAGVTAAMRGRYDGRVFNFESVADPKERREELVIQAIEQTTGAK